MFKDVFNRLLPTGRAYRSGVNTDKFAAGNAEQFDRFNDETELLMAGLIPDNNDFNAKWCSRWESFLDLPAYDFEPLQTRRNRILSMLSPSNPNGSLITRLALQTEIDNAGYTGILFVHENFSGLLPSQVLPQLTLTNQLGNSQLGNAQLQSYNIALDYPYLFSYYQLGTYQMGNAQLGNLVHFTNKIANSLDRYDDTFVNLSPMAHTFYVCGPNLGDIVTLTTAEEEPLRQLILRNKPASSVGFLLINYI